VSENTAENCPVCRKHRGELPAWGGFVYADELIVILHAQPYGQETDHYLGHLFIETRRHVADLADLSEAEAQAIGLYTQRLARALMSCLNIEHVYSFTIVDGAPHMHVHIIGRYQDAPREYWGTKVDEWPGAPRGKEAEMTQICSQLRAFLIEKYGGLQVK